MLWHGQGPSAAVAHRDYDRTLTVSGTKGEAQALAEERDMFLGANRHDDLISGCRHPTAPSWPRMAMPNELLSQGASFWEVSHIKRNGHHTLPHGNSNARGRAQQSLARSLGLCIPSTKTCTKPNAMHSTGTTPNCRRENTQDR